jgi:hypothetical protein
LCCGRTPASDLLHREQESQSALFVKLAESPLELDERLRKLDEGLSKLDGPFVKVDEPLVQAVEPLNGFDERFVRSTSLPSRWTNLSSRSLRLPLDSTSLSSRSTDGS